MEMNNAKRVSLPREWDCVAPKVYTKWCLCSSVGNDVFELWWLTGGAKRFKGFMMVVAWSEKHEEELLSG